MVDRVIGLSSSARYLGFYSFGLLLDRVMLFGSFTREIYSLYCTVERVIKLGSFSKSNSTLDI
jgi:hypothetical protein